MATAGALINHARLLSLVGELTARWIICPAPGIHTWIGIGKAFNQLQQISKTSSVYGQSHHCFSFQNAILDSPRHNYIIHSNCIFFFISYTLSLWVDGSSPRSLYDVYLLELIIAHSP